MRHEEATKLYISYRVLVGATGKTFKLPGWIIFHSKPPQEATKTHRETVARSLLIVLQLLIYQTLAAENQQGPVVYSASNGGRIPPPAAMNNQQDL